MVKLIYALWCNGNMSNLHRCKYSQEQRSTGAIREKGFNFDDPRLMRGAWRNEPNPDLCKVAYFIP
jgi:hypothetical protein